MYNLTRFLVCWPYTLIQEAPDPHDWSNLINYSDTPGDPGGATMEGIIQTEYNSYRLSHGLPTQSVQYISYAEGEAIYLDSYWLPNCPTLPSGLDLCVFDTNVNMGPTEGTMILQFALDSTYRSLAIDGIWGPLTAAAVASITDAVAVIDAYTARREAVYRSFADFGEFGSDWIRRAATIGSQAAAMAGDKTTPRITIPKHVPKTPSWFVWEATHKSQGGPPW